MASSLEPSEVRAFGALGEPIAPPRRDSVRKEHGRDEHELRDEIVLRGESRDVLYFWQFVLSSLPLWLAEQAALALALAGAWMLTVVCGLVAVDALSWKDGIVWFAALSAAGTVTAWLCGLYPAVGISADRELRLTSLAGILLFVGTFFAHATLASVDKTSSLMLLAAGSFCLVLVPVCRRYMRRLCGRFDWWRQPVLVFGGGPSAAQVYLALANAPESGLRPIGIVDDLHRHWGDGATDPAWFVGPWSDAGNLIKQHRVFWGVVPIEEQREEDLGRRLNQLAGLLPHLAVTFGDFAPLSKHTSGDRPFAGIPAMRIEQRLLIPEHKWAKRAIDLALLAVIGPFIFPLMALLAALVYITSPGPVFFSHPRIGMAGRTFGMWKFRSMVVNAEQALKEHLDRDPALRAEWEKFHKLRRDPRVTWIGRILRKTSLDELPQIWNVLRGDMSFVGPRPYPIYEFDEMNRTAPVIMRVRPGVSGLWQISGRSRSTFQDRLRIDAAYVRDWSPWLDLYILARTVKVVATGDGAC
jgi:Undecaprenyl-phosphate galactose phosphotransferase WbaP